MERYSTEELRRMLAKSLGTVGSKDRVAAIRSELDSRGTEEDARKSFFEGLNPTITE